MAQYPGAQLVPQQSYATGGYAAGFKTAGTQGQFLPPSSMPATKVPTAPSSSREHMTELLRNMHRERVIDQLHQNFQVHSIMFSAKPDYVGLLSQKFSSYDEEPEDPINASAAKKENGAESEESVDGDEADIISRSRKRQLATSLRISKIEKILATRNDLSKVERRSLQSRKNTANFRERRKRAAELKHFLNVELDLIQNALINKGTTFFPARQMA